MHAHRVAGDFRDVLVRKRNLVAPVPRADQIGEVLRPLELRHFGNDLFHCERRRCAAVDLASNRRVGYLVSLFVEKNRLGKRGTHVTSAIILQLILFLLDLFAQQTRRLPGI
ncbi:hypothetical protein SDC9_114032 [bioreactor metagenome]|uniref:Uncharacterized protein n=1 Tax=bioreactor metagenome TaxID=1076179 RepID=A0A645BPA5_9ZZZZ